MMPKTSVIDICRKDYKDICQRLLKRCEGCWYHAVKIIEVKDES
jgi:hypothetical protein